MLRALLRDSAIYVIPSIVSRGLAIFLIPLYTRVLTPSDYGSFDLLSAFATLVSLTVALEVAQGVARFYSEEKDAVRRVAYVSTAFWFTVCCYTVFLVIMLLFTGELSVLVMGREGMETAFQLGVIYIYINGVFYLLQNQFRWELLSVHYAVVSVIVTVITALLAVILTYVLAWGLVGLLMAMAMGSMAGCIYGIWYLRHSIGFRFQMARLKEMLSFSAPLVPSGVAVFVSQYVDRLMINHYLTLDDVGVFGVGFRVASIAGLAMMGFQSALTPLIYAHYRDPDTPAQLAKIFRLFMSLALMLFLLVGLFAKEIVALMTVPAYFAAADIVILLVPAILLSNMYIFAPGTAIEKKTHLILWINVCGAILNVVLNGILIPRFGIEGASVAKLISYGLVFGAYMWISQKLYYVPHKWTSLSLATIMFGLIGYGIFKIDLLFSIPITLKIAVAAAAASIILMTGLIRVSELHSAKSAVVKRLL